ncbi:MAG: putative capsular polysaccharide synthesis family protein [Hyphomonadaceae bacterium]|nr:putative capsular polysaccharide synthesis family protein [Hyphomonadaceae bacterium]
MTNLLQGLTIPPGLQKKAETVSRITGRSPEDILEDAIERAVAAHFRPLLLVLQMGKVASTAIAEALDTTRLWDVVHIHHLDAGRLETMETRNAERGVENAPNLVRSRAVLDWLAQDPGQVQIVSAVRDPVARNLSAFFQNATSFLSIEEGKVRNPAEEVADIFVRRYRHSNSLDWFDRNIRRVFRLNVYTKPFDHERKCLVGENRQCRLIVVRAEDSDEIKSQALCRHLGLKSLEISRANVGREKMYSDTYEAVRTILKMPEAILDELYSSQLAQHFYTGAELEQFRAGWLRASPEDAGLSVAGGFGQ